MEQNVDIIIPWLNPTEKWYKDYGDFAKKENPGRVRDLGTFKYLLRSINKNCKWVNKVFIVLYDEEQKPNWLKESDKLKVIYHKDFIPNEFLPNFNSVVTDMFFSKIPDLSDNFIFMNDDMFFMQEIPKNFYFTNTGKPVHQKTLKSGIYKKYNKAQWRYIEENIYNFVNKVCNCELLWSTHHLPIPFKKTLQQFIWHKYNNELLNKLKDSKIRTNKNVCNWIFYGIEEINNLCSFNNIYEKYPCICFDLKNGMSKENLLKLIKNKYIVCFNDGDFLTYDFEKVKNNINTILNEKFPDKSIFEV